MTPHKHLRNGLVTLHTVEGDHLGIEAHILSLLRALLNSPSQKPCQHADPDPFSALISARHVEQHMYALLRRTHPGRQSNGLRSRSFEGSGLQTLSVDNIGNDNSAFLAVRMFGRCAAFRPSLTAIDIGSGKCTCLLHDSPCESQQPWLKVLLFSVITTGARNKRPSIATAIKAGRLCVRCIIWEKIPA